MRTIRQSKSLVSAACSALMAAISLAAIAGWIFHVPLLMRVNHNFAPTQFNTAFCFLFYSAGLLGLEGKRSWLPRLAGVAICCFGILTLAESVFGHANGIDTIFGYYIRDESGSPARMADATAAALIALGTALWVCTLDPAKSRVMAPIVATLGSVVAAVAVAALLGFAAGLHSLNGWIGFTQIGVPTASVCVVAGIHLLWMAALRVEERELWLPIPLVIGLLTILLTVTQELRANEEAAFSVRVQSVAEQFTDRARSRIEDMFAALDRMAERWNMEGGMAEPMWVSDGRTYLHDFRGLVAIESVTAQGRIRWAMPPLAKAVIVEKRLRTEPLRAEPARNARVLGIPQITRTMQLTHGGAGFLYMNPLRRNGSYDGLQIGVVRTSDLLAGVFEAADSSQFSISAMADGVQVFSTSDNPPTAWDRITYLRVRNARWVLRVSPKPEVISQSLSAIPAMFFSVGLVVILLTTLATFLGLRWRGNLRRLREKERDLERSEERYALAVKGSGVGLWDFDCVSGELYWSPRYREILGITDPSFVPPQKEFESRVHAEDRARIFAGISRAIAAGVPYDGEARVRRNDGSYVWLRLRGIPIRDVTGKLIRLSGSIDDISALKRAEEALKASEETFRITMDSAPVGIALLSPDARLIRANPATAKIVGCTDEELLHADPREIIPSVFEEDRAQMRRLIAGEIGSYEMEHELVRRDGKPVWVHINASLARNPDGSPRHIIKQCMDISERREMDRLKSEFISVVSHELRTPLTAIRGSLGLMATAMSASLPEKALQLVQIGYRNCERLIALVNDILDMEKLAANRMPFDMHRENIKDLIRQALEANAAYARKYGVWFHFASSAESADVLVDAARFAQVFANLLSNAAKFSPENGRVEICLRRNGDRARVEVRDCGPGISEAFRSRIFGRFSQADSSIARAKGGTGLGLHITKELVERMGGWIGFESTPGAGATFWIEFPLAAEAARDGGATSSFKPRILVCDDEPQAAHLIRAALEVQGCDVEEAHSLAAAGQALEQRTYDALTLDLVLPDGDGIAFFDELRSRPRTRDLPVIVISIAAAERRDSCSGTALHVVDWIAKPVNEARLAWALRRALKAQREAVPRVLHVEDDADLSRVLAVALRGRAELVTATTIREADDKLANERFAAVILDVGMPDGSGLSLIPFIGSLDPAPPIIVLSAREVTPEPSRLVAEVMIKSRIPEAQIVRSILDIIGAQNRTLKRAV